MSARVADTDRTPFKRIKRFHSMIFLKNMSEFQTAKQSGYLVIADNIVLNR